MPIEQFQRYGSLWELREEYRAQALVALRKREGIPTPELIDGKMQYRQPDGTYSTMAVGARKGQPRELADAHWNSPDPEFEILDVTEDGRRLADELLDLDRDAAGMELGGRVSHGRESEPAPDLVLTDTSDEEVDAKLQEYLKRGKQS
jgi:hypothetical protein